MKTLKYEEVHRNEYRDLAEERAAIHQFLEKVYNQKRLHSARRASTELLSRDKIQGADPGTQR